MRFTRGTGWVGAVLALAVAVALFTRFSFDDTMRRDEAIYAYGGQQLAAGVPLYRGIFDPKTPVAQAPAGAAAALAPGRGFADVDAIRVAFFVAACLSSSRSTGWGSCCSARRWRRCWAQPCSRRSGRSRPACGSGATLRGVPLERP